MTHEHEVEPEEYGEEFPKLKEGLTVVGADGEPVGRIREVFRHIGEIESFGAKGIPPQQPGHDPVLYDYSEAMPGWGDSYFTMQPDEGGVLYVPFSALSRVEGDKAVLAVDADAVPDMGWTARPDALAALDHEYPVDTGGEPRVA